MSKVTIAICARLVILVLGSILCSAQEVGRIKLAAETTPARELGNRVNILTALPPDGMVKGKHVARADCALAVEILAGTKKISPGEQVEFEIRVRNTGNVPVSFPWSKDATVQSPQLQSTQRKAVLTVRLQNQQGTAPLGYPVILYDQKDVALPHGAWVTVIVHSPSNFDSSPLGIGAGKISASKLGVRAVLELLNVSTEKRGDKEVVAVTPICPEIVSGTALPVTVGTR